MRNGSKETGRRFNGNRGGDNGSSSAPQRGGGCLSRIRDAIDDGGSAAVFGSGAVFSGELVLAILELQPEPRGVGGLLAARHDSARVFVFSGSGAAVLDCEPGG